MKIKLAKSLLTVRVISAAVACDIATDVRHIGTGIKFDKRGLKLSVLSSILGFFISPLLFLGALEMEKASVLAPVGGAAIPFGFLLGTLLVRERPSRKAILGMVIVFARVFSATI